MRILVTGARGFIGVPLAAALAREYDVVGSDRDDADLAVPGVAEELVETTHADYIVHLAARYGRILCREAPHAAVVDNAAATAELAAAAAEREIGVLYASSSEVYGDHGEEPITEASSLRTPTTIYGLSKRWGEEALRLYLPSELLTVVRLNMLYGPGQRAGHGCCALATFIRAGLEGQPITAHVGTSRSWCYIDDAVAALELLVGAPGTWNLGNQHDRRSMVEVAALVADRVDGEVATRQPPADQIRHKHYDCSKLEDWTDWRPTTPLEEGIDLTVADARRVGLRDYEGAMA